ncbi:MAG TPA: family 1 glycosylhydrolase, partial [Desulfomonilia bacterium]|nr:family 1 glycosylhydrolase [Desulfomonilia bacterium]
KAVREQIPIKGYIYWSLTDNYEWGTFEPRLGLFEYDYEHGKIKQKSGLGEDAGIFYGKIVQALKDRAHDKIVSLLASD